MVVGEGCVGWMGGWLVGWFEGEGRIGVEKSRWVVREGGSRSVVENGAFTPPPDISSPGSYVCHEF